MTEGLDFIIAGAQKGGTTQLAAMLELMPAVWIRRREDPAFESPHWENGSVSLLIDEIRGTRTEGQAAGIKRASYLGIPEVPARINQRLPHSRVIVVLRDPAARAASAYLHMAQYGRIDLPPVSEALSLLLRGHNLGSPGTSKILAWGRYASLLPAWQQIFGDRLLVLGSQDLRDAPDVSIRKVASHLGIEPVRDGRLPQAVNVGATSMREMRWRRRMHVALNSNDSVTFKRRRPTRNPVRLGIAFVARELARKSHAQVPSRQLDMGLGMSVRKELENYYAEDYEYVSKQFQIKM